MDEKQLQALANELAKNLKIPEDFSQFLKVRQDSRVINKSVFLASGINIEGQKELPGMWLTKNEGAKFWLNVLTELKNRGLNDILIACVDGFPDAIYTMYPEAVFSYTSCNRAYGAQQPALRAMEGLQSRHSRPESDLSGSHGRGRQQVLEAFAAAWDSHYPQIN